MNLIDDLTRQLDKHNLKLERFKEINSRLLAWGMIVHNENGVEQRLYDV